MRALQVNLVNILKQWRFSEAMYEREFKLIHNIIKELELNLTGINILTEIGSNHYIHTPMIAALAGANKVFAVAKDSNYGRKEELIQAGENLSKLWGIDNKIEFITDLSDVSITKADIVTNLSNLRPINRKFIKLLKKNVVIPTMFEAWEFRDSDIDIESCREFNIPVMGTNEQFRNLKIFDYCGILALKLLLEKEVEIINTHILILGGDNFGKTISNTLKKCGCNINLIEDYNRIDLKNIDNVDVVIIANYSKSKAVIGTNGFLRPIQLSNLPKGTIFIQVVGMVEPDFINNKNYTFYPKHSLGYQKMIYPLSYLGPRPVIDLNAAGLKVGELMHRKMLQLNNAVKVEEELSQSNELCQKIKE